MKIAIACSKPWFKISKDILNKNDILFIKNKSDLTLKQIIRFNPDLIFFPHWNWIVSSEIYMNFKCIVFHTAPLPFGRGGSPIQNLILLGYESAPVCALKMIEDIDAGPIYKRKMLSLEGSLKNIFIRLNVIVNEMIRELINNLPEPQEQVGKVFTFKRLNKSNNKLPKKGSLKDIFDRIRMLDDKSYPSAYIQYGNIKIELNEAKLKSGKIVCKANIQLMNNDK